MEHYKYVILGAGPSGLSFAHTLRLLGEESFVVIEKENEAGGLCRSAMVDGKPLDIGGGHFLDLKRQDVLDLLFRFMPREEWLEHKRVSKIRIRGVELDHPLEGNLWQLPVADQIDFLESIAKAGVLRGEPQPESFADWITWKLGDCIAREYMLPYNRKIWSMDPNALGTYWLYKLPDVSFRETLQSCLEHRMFGALPAHGTFLYPKEHGYGEVWRRMGAALGDKLHLGEKFTSADPATRTVNGRYQADCIVNSIPWTAWTQAGSMPDPVRSAIGRLVQVPIDVDYVADTLRQRLALDLRSRRDQKLSSPPVARQLLSRFQGLLDGNQHRPLAQAGAGRVPPHERVRLPGQHARQAAGGGNRQAVGGEPGHLRAGALGPMGAHEFGRGHIVGHLRREGTARPRGLSGWDAADGSFRLSKVCLLAEVAHLPDAPP